MKIITNLQNKTINITEYSNADYLVIPTKFSSYSECIFLENEIKSLRERTDKNLIINVDKVIYEEELEDLYKFIECFINENYYFMFSDFSILSYFKDKNMLEKLFYNSPTYICNRFDIEYYQRLGIKVFVSNELSIDDLKINSKYNNCVLTAYGYYPIYYSKRKVLSLFKENFNFNFDSKDTEFEMVERNDNTNLEVKDSYKILENDESSLIFSAKKIFIFQELNECKYEYIYLNSFKTKEIIEVINLYSSAIKTDFNSNLELKIKNIDERLDSSLIYLNPSILNKENA